MASKNIRGAIEGTCRSAKCAAIELGSAGSLLSTVGAESRSMSTGRAIGDFIERRFGTRLAPETHARLVEVVRIFFGVLVVHRYCNILGYAVLAPDSARVAILSGAAALGG